MALALSNVSVSIRLPVPRGYSEYKDKREGGNTAIEWRIVSSCVATSYDMPGEWRDVARIGIVFCENSGVKIGKDVAGTPDAQKISPEPGPAPPTHKPHPVRLTPTSALQDYRNQPEAHQRQRRRLGGWVLFEFKADGTFVAEVNGDDQIACIHSREVA